MLLFLRHLLPNSQPNNETNNSNMFTLLRILIRTRTRTHSNIRSPIPIPIPIRTCTHISTCMLLAKVLALSRIPLFLRSRNNKLRRRLKSRISR